MRDIADFRLLDDLPSDCFDMLVASYSQWLKKEHRFLYAGCLGAKFNTRGATLGDILTVDKGDILDNAQSNGLAVRVCPKSCLSAEKLRNLLDRYNPLMAELDEYDCAWRANYRKLHRYHYILLRGFVQEEDRFLCIDTYPTRDDFSLPAAYIVKHVLRILCFWDDHKIPPISDPRRFLKTAIQKYYGSNVAQSDRERLERLAARFDALSVADEVKGYEDAAPLYVPAIWKLKNIQWSYKQFEMLLAYIGMDQSQKIQEYLSEISVGWEILTNALTLRIIQKSAVLPAAAILENLRKAINFEELMFMELRYMYDYGYCNHYPRV